MKLKRISKIKKKKIHITIVDYLNHDKLICFSLLSNVSFISHHFLFLWFLFKKRNSRIFVNCREKKTLTNKTFYNYHLICEIDIFYICTKKEMLLYFVFRKKNYFFFKLKNNKIIMTKPFFFFPNKQYTY